MSSLTRAWNVQLTMTDTMSQEGDVHPMIRSILALRGIDDDREIQKFFAPNYENDLHDPFLFADMSCVVERIREAISVGEHIGVFGDYDADGITSSVILRRTLERLGCPVSVYIPDKLTEGHGLHVNALDAFASKGIRLLFTVDCGMMNHTEIRVARSRGMDVVIVDHHHVPEELPEAFAIINPKLPNSQYPFRELCGAGTTFKLAQALYRSFLPEYESELKWILDFAAIGTVADCVPLVGENRVLVKYGLIVLSKTRHVGLREMFSVGKIVVDEDHIPDAHTIGFRIGPRINAASRMAHALTAHELLMATQPDHARLLALDLESQNAERQKVSGRVADEVRAMADTDFRNRSLVFAVSAHFPFGVAGLVAGKVARDIEKPVAVFHKGEIESTGSFRSVPGLSIIEAIESCADLLEKFGGHEQAAGATIRNDNLEAFQEKLEHVVATQLAGTQRQPELLIDCELSPFYITPKFFATLKKLAPFGMGNAEPIFLLRNVSVESVRCVGKDNQHLKASFRTDAGVFGAIGFGIGETWSGLLLGDRVDIVFHLQENRWNGSSRIEFDLLDICRAGEHILNY